MVSAKRLAQMAKKWQRMAAMGRKRLTRTTSASESASVGESCMTTSPSVAVKGRCVVYTADGARFEVPLEYLSTEIVGELLRMSHDEFGFPSDGRIILPCDAAVMAYVLFLLRRNASEELQRALLSSVLRPCHWDSGFEPTMGIRSVAVSTF